MLHVRLRAAGLGIDEPLAPSRSRCVRLRSPAHGFRRRWPNSPGIAGLMLEVTLRSEAQEPSSSSADHDVAALPVHPDLAAHDRTVRLVFHERIRGTKSRIVDARGAPAPAAVDAGVVAVPQQLHDGFGPRFHRQIGSENRWRECRGGLVAIAAANVRQWNADRLSDVFIEVPFFRGVTEGSMLPRRSIARCSFAATLDIFRGNPHLRHGCATLRGASTRAQSVPFDRMSC